MHEARAAKSVLQFLQAKAPFTTCKYKMLNGQKLDNMDDATLMETHFWSDYRVRSIANVECQIAKKK